MESELLDEELNMMYPKSDKANSINAETFMQPVKVMNPHKPVMFDIGSTVADAVSLMQIKQFGCLLVTREEKLVGILTERDIVTKVLGSDRDLSEIMAQEIMTPNPESFMPDDSIAFVMNAMTLGSYRHVPIVNEFNQPVGIVSVKDIVSFICEHFSDEVMNLPPKPMRTFGERDGA